MKHMVKKWFRPARADRRMWVFGTIVLVLIVSWWVYMLKIKNRRPSAASETAAQEIIVPADPNGPQISFPESARSDNPEINKFVIEFVNILLTSDYKAYRLKVTQRREPINAKTFDDAYGRVKAIEIRKIEKIEDRKALKQVKLGDIPLPIYRVKAHIVLRDKSEQEVEIPIFKEQNRWVSSR